MVHFEIPYDNKTHTAAVYEKAFGWDAKALGEEKENFVLANSGPVGGDNLPAPAPAPAPGTRNGGSFPKIGGRPQQLPYVVIAVVDVAKSMEQVRQAGGKILGEPMEISGVGRYVSFHDSEGNRRVMLQAVPLAQ